MPLSIRTATLGLLRPEARRRLLVKPALEEFRKDGFRFELKKGLCYLLKEEKPERSFAVFADQVTHADPATGCAEGLCLTRTPPARIRDEYQLAKTPILWVGEQPPTADVQAANDCEEILYTLAKFLKHCPSPVVVFDCLEYLCQTADFRKTLKFVYHVKELAIKHNARVIFSVNPRSFPGEQLALLEKELEPLPANGGPGR